MGVRDFRLVCFFLDISASLPGLFFRPSCDRLSGRQWCDRLLFLQPLDRPGCDAPVVQVVSCIIDGLRFTPHSSISGSRLGILFFRSDNPERADSLPACLSISGSPSPRGQRCGRSAVPACTTRPLTIRRCSWQAAFSLNQLVSGPRKGPREYIESPGYPLD